MYNTIHVHVHVGAKNQLCVYIKKHIYMYIHLGRRVSNVEGQVRDIWNTVSVHQEEMMKLKAQMREHERRLTQVENEE